MTAGHPSRARASNAGITLVELLLALFIAGLVVAVVYSTYHTVMTALQGQRLRRAGPDAAAAALDLVIRDLTCAAVDDSGCAVTLTEREDGDQPAALSFCTARPPEAKRDLRWTALEHVTYRLSTGADPVAGLICEWRPLAGPGADTGPATNLVAGGVDHFVVRLFDGDDWQSTWPPEDKGAGFPLAARVELGGTWGAGRRVFKADIFIPAGNTVTSSLIRAAAPAS